MTKQTKGQGKHNIAIGGDVSGSIIITGNHNIVQGSGTTVNRPAESAGPAVQPPPSVGDLKNTLVRIYDIREQVVGAGFLVGARHILTCWHVVEHVRGENDTVTLDFPFLHAGRLTASLQRLNEEQDTAVLLLKEDPPAGAFPVRPVAVADLWGHPFRSFGFPSGYPDGVWATGLIRGPNARDWLQIEDVKTTGHFVQPGFSGSPIWDDEVNGVVGMVVAAERDPGVRAAFCIPTPLLLQVWPEGTCHTPGPSAMSNPFCERGRINDPTRLFDRQRILRELRQMLAAGNSVSLVGESEIGKSSVLYALYRAGREWFPHGVVHYVDLQGVFDTADFCGDVLAGMGREPGDLRALKQALRKERLVLLLDEVEKLARPAFTADLHDLLRALAQGATLTLAVASHRPLDAIFPPSNDTSSFHNIFVSKRLGPFSPEETRAFLAHRPRHPRADQARGRRGHRSPVGRAHHRP